MSNSNPRRNWLKQSAILATGTLIGNNQAAQAASDGKSPTTPKIPIAVSTYSYWHFKAEKYPIEKVIEHAARVGFDGVEILHRQMQDESPAYINKLKRLA